jgi:hypothetical protein
VRDNGERRSTAAVSDSAGSCADSGSADIDPVRADFDSAGFDNADSAEADRDIVNTGSAIA